MNVGELIEYLYRLDPTTLVFTEQWSLDETLLEVYDYEAYTRHPPKSSHPPKEHLPSRPACGKVLQIG